MEKDKIKKKKLTISISSKKTYSAPQYTQSRQKTSVVIEKKSPRRWVDKKSQQQNNNFARTKSPSSFFSKKPPINKNYDIRKMAEDRATKRFKNTEQDK